MTEDFNDPNFQYKFNELLNSLNTLSKNLDPKNHKVRDWKDEDGKSTSVLHKARNAHGKLKTATDKVTDHFALLAGGSDGLIRKFREIAEVVVLGKVFTNLFEGGKKLGESYTNLANIGQTFGGSMIQMGLQAAQAGVPLATFSELLMRQSTAAAVMATSTQAGSETLGLFAKGVTQNLKGFGLYGMTIEQVNNMTADYAELLRKQNLLTGANTKVNTASVTQFAADLADFSAVTGKAKDEITRETTAALSDTSLNEVQLSSAQMQQLTGATSFLASLPGDTGTQLSQMLAQTVGMGGVQFTAQAQEFYGAGTGQLLQPIQNLADSVMNGTANKGDYVNFVKYMQSQDVSLMPYLRDQIRAGNQQAVAVANLLQSMRGLNADQFAQQQKNEEGLTKFFNTLQVTMNTLTSSFDTGFFGVLTDIQNSLGDAGQSITDMLGPMFQTLGTAAGDFVKMLLSPAMIENYKELFTRIAKFIDHIKPQTITTWVDAIGAVMGLFIKGLKLTVDVISYFSHHLGQLTTLLALYGTQKIGKMFGINPLGLLAKTVVDKIFGRSTGFMTVKAGVVNIMGQGGSLLNSLKNRAGGWFGKGAGAAAGEGAADLGAGAGMGFGGTGAAAETVAATSTLASTIAGMLAPLAVIAGSGYLDYKMLKSADFATGWRALSHPELLGKMLFGHVTAADFAHAGFQPADKNIFGQKQPTETLQQQYVDLQKQIDADNATDQENAKNAKVHALMLSRIAALLAEQNQLQKEMGAKGINLQQQAVAAAEGANKKNPYR